MSVDPFITFPEDGQSLNPYSYVMNNPLKYTDPTGYATKIRLSLKARNKLSSQGITNVRFKVSDTGVISLTAQIKGMSRNFGSGASNSGNNGEKGSADAGTPTAPETNETSVVSSRNEDMHPSNDYGDSTKQNNVDPFLTACIGPAAALCLMPSSGASGIGVGAVINSQGNNSSESGNTGLYGENEVISGTFSAEVGGAYGAPGPDDVPPPDDEQKKKMKTQDHHMIPHNNGKWAHHNHPLVKQSDINLKNESTNMIRLLNHSGRHSTEYHQLIRTMMDTGFKRVAGQGQMAARNEMFKIMNKLNNGISNQTIRLYKAKSVWNVFK